MTITWVSDGPVSMPEPCRHEARVPMEGFCFTPNGMDFDVDEVHLEEIQSQAGAPKHD